MTVTFSVDCKKFSLLFRAIHEVKLTRVVSAKRQEVIPIDGKKASCVGGAGVRFAAMLTFRRLPLRKFRFLKTHIMQDFKRQAD